MGIFPGLHSSRHRYTDTSDRQRTTGDMGSKMENLNLGCLLIKRHQGKVYWLIFLINCHWSHYWYLWVCTWNFFPHSNMLVWNVTEINLKMNKAPLGIYFQLKRRRIIKWFWVRSEPECPYPPTRVDATWLSKCTLSVKTRAWYIIDVWAGDGWKISEIILSALFIGILFFGIYDRTLSDLYSNLEKFLDVLSS